MDIESTLKLDPSSPIYLGSGDQPGNLITHVILTGDYFGFLRQLLWHKSRRKFVFIDSTITKPMDSNKILDWETVNTMLVSWMLRSMDAKVSASIPYFDKAKTLLDYLEKRFCVANGLRLQQLIASIIDFKQSHYMTITDCYSRLFLYMMILLDLNLFMGALIGQIHVALFSLPSFGYDVAACFKPHGFEWYMQRVGRRALTSNPPIGTNAHKGPDRDDAGGATIAWA
ncbi:Protein aurora borealis [Bienertia sinuspersici]